MSAPGMCRKRWTSTPEYELQSGHLIVGPDDDSRVSQLRFSFSLFFPGRRRHYTDREIRPRLNVTKKAPPIPFRRMGLVGSS
jgi:hypothetical protein